MLTPAYGSQQDGDEQSQGLGNSNRPRFPGGVFSFLGKYG